MTIKNSVETIKQIFPNVMDQQVIKDLDKAQKEFIDETFYLETYYSLTGISTNTVWSLPPIFNKLKEILFYDSNGNPLYKGDLDIDYEIEFGNLYFKSVTAEPLIQMPNQIGSIYVGFFLKPQPLNSLISSYSVNDEHVNAIEAKVYKDYYAKFPVDVMTRTGDVIKTRDFTAVRYWQGEEINGRINAKRWINNKNNSNTEGEVINYGMGGKFQLPLRRIQSGAGTLQPLGNLFSKYFKFTAVNGIPIISSYSFGWTTLPTVSYSVGLGTHPNIFTITSADSEFTSTMVSDSNNKDNHIDAWGASAIELSFGDATGTVIVTIIEWL